MTASPSFRAVLYAATLLLGSANTAGAQQSVNDVLSFLLTNRSIPTGDFLRDEQAAAATRDSISAFLLLELATVPVTPSAGAFTYRLDPALGTVVRSSDSFGPFFTERSLTVGSRKASVGLSFQTAEFGSIEGQSLSDGTLVATASRLRGDQQPFDIETLTLQLRASTTTFTANIGVTDRLDVSAAVPLVRLSMSGQRLDTYRGTELIQAIGSATASGLGDVLVRAKYNLFRTSGGGVAIGGDVRFPTGETDNLLGTGETVFKPRAIASIEAAHLGLHGDVGYAVGGLARELSIDAAVTAVAFSKLTFIGEVVTRRFEGVGRLEEITQPHPTLANVETIRLTGLSQPLSRAVAIAGVKWNIAGTWLVSANVTWPLTEAGLNARWVPAVTVDYSFGQ